MDYNAEALRRHRETRGKMGIVSRMPLETIEDLSIAYTPGVGAVSLAVAEDTALSYEMTNRGNTVAVVSDGSAVLGLGNIGPEGAMPVMEGKAILFKELAGIDAFPICLATQSDDEIVETVTRLAPSFGGVNLEDISAPRCFGIEERLQDIGIPVFHDDQHGTAVVILGGLLNALKVTGKALEEVRIVFSGAGASGVASAKILFHLGAKHVILVDSQGTIHKGRENLSPIKREMLAITNADDIRGGLEDAVRGADVFIGLSVAGAMTPAMVESMAKDPIIFAMANPVPEIMPEEARAAGAAVVGTGRSDFANQINNCLAFPGVFRGALDVRAPRITMEMKVAAARALAGLVETPVAERVIPWALDKAVVPAIAKAVAGAWTAESGRAAAASKSAAAGAG